MSDPTDNRSPDPSPDDPAIEPGRDRDRSECVEPRPSRISRGRLSSLEERQ